MRRSVLLLPALAIAAAACTGGGGKSLSVGTYVISSAATQKDECQALGDLASAVGTTFLVDAVTSTGFTFDFGKGPFGTARSGDTFSASVTRDIDWADTASTGLVAAYDCQEHDGFTFSGKITGHDKASFAEDAQYGDTSGTAADCIAANASGYGLTLAVWPCESTGTFDGAKQ